MDKKKRYSVLFWDADNTLTDFIASEKEALRTVFAHYGMDADEEIHAVYSAINDAYWKRLEKKEVTKEEVRTKRFLDLFQEFKPGGTLEHKQIDFHSLEKIDIEEFCLFFQEALGSVYYYFDDSFTLCKKFKEEGFLQYIITNGITMVQQKKLTLAGFSEVMEDIYISEGMGADKPDPAFFEACFEKMKKSGVSFDKKDILVIGDSFTSDMQGANNAGLDCCLYSKKEKIEIPEHLKINYQIKNLWQLEEIVWQDQQNKS